DDSWLPEALRAASRRDLALESEALGVRGSVDLLEPRDGSVTVVEAKHGASPRDVDHCWESFALPYRAWPGDVAQVVLYMALLREAGVPCEDAVILYRKDRHRCSIAWSSELEAFAHAVV